MKNYREDTGTIIGNYESQKGVTVYFHRKNAVSYTHLESQELKPVVMFKAQNCVGCGNCEVVCPTGASNLNVPGKIDHTKWEDGNFPEMRTTISSLCAYPASQRLSAHPPS